MNYAKATTVRLSGEPTDDAQRKADERMRHDYPILQQFHSKHALGALSAPSCLCCGQQTHPVTRPIAVQHMELPAIVVCKQCKDATVRAEGGSAAAFEPLWFMRLRHPDGEWGGWIECDAATVNDLRRNVTTPIYEVRQFVPVSEQ